MFIWFHTYTSRCCWVLSSAYSAIPSASHAKGTSVTGGFPFDASEPVSQSPVLITQAYYLRVGVIVSKGKLPVNGSGHPPVRSLCQMCGVGS